MNPDSDLSPNHKANKNSNTLEFTLEKLKIPSVWLDLFESSLGNGT